MEVHHHSQTPRKKWTHYFWEFLMLFLAVFCGFFAEYQLEHKIERDREKEYIHTLISDLQEDTTALTRFISYFQQKGVELDSLIFLLSSADIKNNGRLLYYYGRKTTRLGYFYSTDRTIQQMRNSGAFRLVKSNNAANGIIRYYSAMTGLNSLQESTNQIIAQYRQVSHHVFNPVIFQTMVNDSTNNMIIQPAGNPSLVTYDRPAILQIISIVHYLQSGRMGIQQRYKDIKENATELITLLKKEYRLK
jgi:hypothetical protein